MNKAVSRIATAVMLATTFAVSSAHAQADDYPNKPIRLIVPYATGGGVDIVARLLGNRIAASTGASVIVENRTGAGSNVGSTFVAKSAPDGYTLLLGSNANAVNNALYSDMQYNAATDLTPVILVGTVPMVLLASPSVSPKNLSELLELAKSKPGSLNFGSGGNGTAEHLAFELFKRQTGLDALHVPYRGGAQVYTDLIGGQIQFMFNNQLGATSYIRSGQLRALGTTANPRSTELPDVATFTEQGLPEFKVFVWWGVMGPAGMPPALVNKINKMFAEAIQSPEVKERLQSLGAQPRGGSPEQFSDFFKSEMATWSSVIKEANIKIN